MGYIYQIINQVNGHSLIGQTIQCPPENRWKTHLRLLRKGVHKNPHLQAAYNKYGESAFTFKATCMANECLDFMEWMLIKVWGYYNLREGGDAAGGRLHSLETIEKLRKKGKLASQKWHASLTFEQKEEWKNAISIAKKGKHPGKEQIERLQRPARSWQSDPVNRKIMSERCKGWWSDPVNRKIMSERRRGKKCSVEHRRKLSLALTGIQRSKETKVKMSIAQRKRRGH
jgi:group I intron endonuclease